MGSNYGLQKNGFMQGPINRANAGSGRTPVTIQMGMETYCLEGDYKEPTELVGYLILERFPKN